MEFLSHADKYIEDAKNENDSEAEKVWKYNKNRQAKTCRDVKRTSCIRGKK